MDKRELSQTVQATVAFTSPAYIRLLEAYVVRAKERFVADSPPIRNAQRRVDETRAEHEQAVAWMAEQGYEVTPSADASDYGRVGQVPLNKMRKIKVRKGAPTVEATPAPVVIDAGDNFQKYLEAEAIRAATEEGLRVAGDAEAGWVYHHRTDYGEMVTLWVTDEPAPVEAEAPANEPNHWQGECNPETCPLCEEERESEQEWARKVEEAEAADYAGWLDESGRPWDDEEDDEFQVTPPFEEDTWGDAPLVVPALHIMQEVAKVLTHPRFTGVEFRDHCPSRPWGVNLKIGKGVGMITGGTLLSALLSAALEVEARDACSCGATQEGYKGRGPHHYKNCPMYSQEGRDQETRMLTRESSTLPQLYQQAACPRMDRGYWEMWERECEDYLHNDYRG